MLEGEHCETRQDFSRALLHYMEVLAIDPQHIDAWCRLGRIFMIGQEWSRAIEVLETALQLQPHLAYAQKLLALAHFNLGRRELARNLIDDAAKRSKESSVWVLRAWIHSNLNQNPAHTLAVYQDWGRRFADPLTRKASPLIVQDRDPARRLRVGYVTADFREHSIAFFMQPVLKHHNPEQVEVHVFSGGVEDHITKSMRESVSHWHEVSALTDEELHQLIRSLRIDVLVDLSGHTEGGRLLVFARRAAPVQVTWLGFMNTLGMRAMDYRLTDGGTDPDGSEIHYSEKLFRLTCMASYAPPSHAPLRESPPMLISGHPTLISLNNSFKITDEMLRLWSRILTRQTDAHLIIMVKESTAEAAQINMGSRVENAGLPLDRVFVMPQLPLTEFMELGFAADVALDTSPVSGGTTTLHALWMGLPVIAMDAERAIDSSSARILSGIGLGEWVAANETEYVDICVNLLRQPDRLIQHRATVRNCLQSCVLMDYKARTDELENSYRLMWINYLSQQNNWRHSQADMSSAIAATRNAMQPPKK